MISLFQAKVVYIPFPDRHEPLSRQVYLNPFIDFLQQNTPLFQTDPEIKTSFAGTSVPMLV